MTVQVFQHSYERQLKQQEQCCNCAQDGCGAIAGENALPDYEEWLIDTAGLVPDR